MNQQFACESINPQPPISAITVNKFNVVFKDNEELKSVKFQNSNDTKEFLNWLVTI